MSCNINSFLLTKPISQCFQGVTLTFFSSHAVDHYLQSLSIFRHLSGENRNRNSPKLLDQVRFRLRRLGIEKRIHDADLAVGYGHVWMPDALARKYRGADSEWIWQYVFPAKNRSEDPRSYRVGRHHHDESNLQRAVKLASICKTCKRIS